MTIMIDDGCTIKRYELVKDKEAVKSSSSQVNHVQNNRSLSTLLCITLHRILKEHRCGRDLSAMVGEIRCLHAVVTMQWEFIWSSLYICMFVSVTVLRSVAVTIWNFKRPTCERTVPVLTSRCYGRFKKTLKLKHSQELLDYFVLCTMNYTYPDGWWRILMGWFVGKCPLVLVRFSLVCDCAGCFIVISLSSDLLEIPHI